MISTQLAGAQDQAPESLGCVAGLDPVPSSQFRSSQAIDFTFGDILEGY
uniref:Uncharacterized protein n=1 Tax=uncultured marine microorganism HF4000_005H07 TaxID=455506 RepID=B3T0D5_9ZZZZ|nr:hypothetical protein ALOHA_HF4000005H07ctg1g12 [uncultured marine microorganism HF4000_005H07]